jgi:hypothetical protein
MRKPAAKYTVKVHWFDGDVTESIPMSWEEAVKHGESMRDPTFVVKVDEPEFYNPGVYGEKS